MNYVRLLRWPPSLGIPLLAVALLFTAQPAFAQVVQVATPQMEHERQMLDQRLATLDQRWTDFDQRFQALPAEQRAEHQAHFDELARKRTELRADVKRLENVPTAQWMQRFDPVHDRMTQFEIETQRFAMAHGWEQPPTAAEMTRLRADLSTRFDALDREIGRFEARVEAAPQAERAALQRELTAMQRERDQLRADIADLEGVQADQWAARYRPVETRLDLFETRAGHFEPTAAAPRPAQQLTAADRDRQRTQLEERLQRIDADMAGVERRIAAVPDAQVRADLDTELERLRQDRDQVRQDVTALEGVSADQWATRYRPAGEAVARYEADFHRMALAATPARAQHLSLAEQRLQAQRERLADMHRQLDFVPEAERGEMAYELIRLRSQYDDVWRTQQRMRFAPVATFEQLRTEFPDQVAQLETEVNMAHVDMIAGAGVAVGPGN